jgi:multiple sugar transport system ATP-binding protein
MNFIAGEARAGNGTDAVGDIVLPSGGNNFVFTPASGEIKIHDGKKLTLGIRPEYISISASGATPAKTYAALPSGMETIVKIHLGELILTSVIFGAIDYKVNTEINIDFTGENCILFDENGVNLGLGKVRII